MNNTKYIYVRETAYSSEQEAITAAFRDIEHNLAEPLEIVDKEGNLILPSEEIYERFVKSNHEPLAPPTIRARVVNKQDEVRRVGWLAKMKSKLNSALAGNPGYWQ